MGIDVKLQVKLSLDEAALEDDLAEFDEITVTEMVKQVLDKAIALDGVECEVIEGPNTLDEFDAARPGAKSSVATAVHARPVPPTTGLTANAAPWSTAQAPTHGRTPTRSAWAAHIQPPASSAREAG